MCTGDAADSTALANRDRTWHCGSQKLLQVVPEGQLITRHQEARTKKKCPSQPHEGIVGNEVFCSGTAFASDSLQEVALLDEAILQRT